MDAAFDRLLTSAYGEEDIGGLDFDDSIAGPLSLSAFASALHLNDGASTQSSPPLTQDLAPLSSFPSPFSSAPPLSLDPLERGLVQRHMKARMKAMDREEEEEQQGKGGQSKGEEGENGGADGVDEAWLPPVYRRGEGEEKWDVESALSQRTANHSEHQPSAIREGEGEKRRRGGGGLTALNTQKGAQQRPDSSAVEMKVGHDGAAGGGDEEEGC